MPLARWANNIHILDKTYLLVTFVGSFFFFFAIKSCSTKKTPSYNRKPNNSVVKTNLQMSIKIAIISLYRLKNRMIFCQIDYCFYKGIIIYFTLSKTRGPPLYALLTSLCMQSLLSINIYCFWEKSFHSCSHRVLC